MCSIVLSYGGKRLLSKKRHTVHLWLTRANIVMMHWGACRQNNSVHWLHCVLVIFVVHIVAAETTSSGTTCTFTAPVKAVQGWHVWHWYALSSFWRNTRSQTFHNELM